MADSPEKKRLTSFYLDDETRERIAEVAKRHDLTSAFIIRKLIKQNIGRLEEQLEKLDM